MPTGEWINFKLSHLATEDCAFTQRVDRVCCIILYHENDTEPCSGTMQALNQTSSVN